MIDPMLWYIHTVANKIQLRSSWLACCSGGQAAVAQAAVAVPAVGGAAKTVGCRCSHCGDGHCSRSPCSDPNVVFASVAVAVSVLGDRPNTVRRIRKGSGGGKCSGDTSEYASPYLEGLRWR